MTYVYIYIYIQMYVYIYIYTYLPFIRSITRYMCLYTGICMHVLCIVCMYVLMCIYIYTYTYAKCDDEGRSDMGPHGLLREGLESWGVLGFRGF